jgi:acetyltransferase-like isoleucine patch superfamily enzyme
MISFIKNRVSSFRFRKQFPNLILGDHVKIIGPSKNLKINGKVEIQSFSIIHLGGYSWSNYSGKLSIGSNSILGFQSLIYAAGPEGVEIGDNFDCAPGVKIFASRTDYLNKTKHVFDKVTIGDNVVVFANCVISPGVTIGANSVIAAGSVVTRDIPENVLAGGAPASVIRSIN